MVLSASDDHVEENICASRAESISIPISSSCLLVGYFGVLSDYEITTISCCLLLGYFKVLFDHEVTTTLGSASVVHLSNFLLVQSSSTYQTSTLELCPFNQYYLNSCNATCLRAEATTNFVAARLYLHPQTKVGLQEFICCLRIEL